MNSIFQAVATHTALSSCGRVSSLKLLSGSLSVSHRPCDRCYSCQPGTVHRGHAVIALDATLNRGWGGAASWARGGEKRASGVTDIWPPLLFPLTVSGGHILDLRVEFAATIGFLAALVSELGSDFILEKGAYLRARKSLLPA